MKVLIAATHYPVASGRYAADALRRLGHDVRTVGASTGAIIWDMEVDDRYIWAPDLPDKDWTPDLVIYMDGNLPSPTRLYEGVPHVVYGVDNHVRDYHQYDGVVDHFFLGHGHGLRIGEDNVTWLPCGFDPEAFTPSTIDWADRAWDTALLAVMYGQRGALIAALNEHVPGLRNAYGTGPVYDQYAGIYQNARLSLVASANDDVAQRVWETAAMGCLVIKDYNSDDEALGLEHLNNCLMYPPGDMDQFATLVRIALSAEKATPVITDIAKAGQQWAQSGTWDARLQVIIDWATLHKPKAKAKAAKAEKVEPTDDSDN